jgi:hypothetical protein
MALKIASLAARILCSAVAVFLLVMAAGSLTEAVRKGWEWTTESTLIVTAATGFGVGAAIAWWRETIGGAIATFAGLAMQHPLFVIPGFLVLCTGWLKRKREHESENAAADAE